MDEMLVEKYTDEENHIVYKKCKAFTNGKKYFLLNELGYSILIDHELFNMLQQKKVSTDFASKLLQHRLAEFDNLNDCDLCTNYKIRPEFFMIDLTTRCNLNCKYCFRDVNNPESYKSISKEMLNEICKYIFDYCTKHEVKKISIQPWGGEPLLEMEKIKWMYDFFENTPISVHFTIETNGVLLTEENVKWLFEHNVSIGISIDGNKEIHDRQRVFANTKGSFEYVLQGIKNVKKYYGDNFGIINTITRKSIEHIEDILDFYAKDINIKHVKFNFVHESEFAANLCLNKEQVIDGTKRVYKKIMSLNNEGYNIIDMNIRHKLLNLLIRDNSDICVSQGCTGGTSMIVFDMEGYIYPCELTDYIEERIGNVKEAVDLIKIVKEAKETKAYFKEKDDVSCLSCSWRYFCKGGCSIKAKLSRTKKDDLECTVNSTLYPEMIESILSEQKLINDFLNMKIIGG